MSDAKNIFEAQVKFLELIQELVDGREIDLMGDELLGFEFLLSQYRAMDTTIKTIDCSADFSRLNFQPRDYNVTSTLKAVK